MTVAILSLLCRADAVRLVRLTGTAARPHLTDVAEVVPEANAPPAALATLAARTALAAGLGAERIVLGLDGARASLRRLRFPFTSRRKVDLVLGPEFEPHLPFPLSGAALSWARTGLEPSPAAVVLAAAYPLADLTAMLDALAEHLLPPSAACLDLAGLDALLGQLAPTGVSLLLGLDGARASIICRLSGRPAIWRTLTMPSTDTAARAELLAREILLTVSAVEPRPPRDLRLFLAGDMDAALAEALGQALPATPVAVSDQPAWPRLPDATPLPDRFAAAYGLGLLALADPDAMNFLRGDLAPAIAPSLKRRGTILAAASLAALLVSAVLGLLYSYGRLDRAIEATTAHTAALVAQAAPDASSGLTLNQKLSVLRGRLAEQDDLAKSRAAASGSSIEILAALHKALGSSAKVRVRRIAADEQHVTIDATADDYNTVDTVKRNLAATPFFKEVEIKGAKNVPEKKQVEFQLDIRLGGMGDSDS